MKLFHNITGFVLVFLAISLDSTAQKVISNYEALFGVIQTESYVFKNNNLRNKYAANTVLASKLNIVDFQGSMNASITNNVKLPVNILPGEVFGGQPGSTKEIRTGTPYNVGVPFNAEVKLYNPVGWADYKLAKLNVSIVETDSKLSQKNLYENLLTLYYNIIQLQEQQKSTERNLAVADTLLKITENRYKVGLIKQQDVNDAKVNIINVKESIKQIDFLKAQQILSIKTLADLSDSIVFVFNERIDDSEVQLEQASIVKNNLSVNNFLQKEQYAKAYIKRTKQSLLPSVSFVFNNTNNQFSQRLNLIDNSWISSRYIGLRLNVALPNAQTLSNQNKAKYDYQMAVNNTKQASIKADIDYKKLQVAIDKALSQIEANKEVLQLQKDTYEKNRNLYKEGLQSIDRTLGSLNNWLQAEYNLVTSKISLALAKANININNKIQ
jgi:outer membrane protein